MKTSDPSGGRSGGRELALLLALLVPGCGLFLWGLAVCSDAGRLCLPGAAVSAVGLCLVTGGGYYHYRTDYRRTAARGALVWFLALAALSALMAVLANLVLFR